jgi:hypothetical protein
MTPQMNTTQPIITRGLTGGLLMINVRPYRKFGQPPRFELVSVTPLEKCLQVESY